MDQDPGELLALEVAMTAESVFSKQANGGSWTEAEAEFVGWVETDG